MATAKKLSLDPYSLLENEAIINLQSRVCQMIVVGVERRRVDDVGAVGFGFSVSPPKFINRVAQSSTPRSGWAAAIS